jgi:hypothetical protein
MGFPSAACLIRRRRPTPPFPDDLVDAVVARVQLLMVQAGPLTWFGTGINPGADVDPLPYASLGEPDEDDSYWTTQGDGAADGHLVITCYAGTKKAARKLGDQMFAAMQDAPLQFAAGRLVYLRQVGRSAELDPDPAPGGGDCWAEIRQFRYMYSF